jgi:hypothetical protein
MDYPSRAGLIRIPPSHLRSVAIHDFNAILGCVIYGTQSGQSGWPPIDTAPLPESPDLARRRGD